MNESKAKSLVDFWHRPFTVEKNNFKFKSLSNFSANVAIGCGHACRFCYVPEVSTNRMASALEPLGVTDPDAQWGEYLYLRTWQEKTFLGSLARAMREENLPEDGHRAVMYCTTTDAYQVIHHKDPEQRRHLQASLAHMVRKSLELIRDKTDLNVRILTRSPLAKFDFDIFKSFGKRLTFGMSLPTLDNKLAKVYEPKAPAPSQRLETLRMAKEAGLHVYVAMAPVYPECSSEDIRKTMEAIRELNPITIFQEPINIRAENVERIRLNGIKEGVKMEEGIFDTPTHWRNYAYGQLTFVEGMAHSLGLADRLHLWPDASLGSKEALREWIPRKPGYANWLDQKWGRISEWPGINF